MKNLEIGIVTYIYRCFPAYSQIQGQCLENTDTAEVCVKIFHLWYYFSYLPPLLLNLAHNVFI